MNLKKYLQEVCQIETAPAQAPTSSTPWWQSHTNLNAVKVPSLKAEELQEEALQRLKKNKIKRKKDKIEQMRQIAPYKEQTKIYDILTSKCNLGYVNSREKASNIDV